MIRCEKCQKLWPTETVFCGSCGGSLGCRYCSNGHENPLSARYCTVCGDHKLSYGVPVTNLRPRLYLGLAFIGVCVFSAVFPPMVSSLQSLHAPIPSLDGFLRLVLVLSLAVFVLAGQKGRKVVLCFYWGAIKFFARTVVSLVSSLMPKDHDYHGH